jgi:hypothetical protein
MKRLHIDPHNEETHERLGDAYYGLKKYQLALGEYIRSIDPEFEEMNE